LLLGRVPADFLHEENQLSQGHSAMTASDLMMSELRQAHTRMQTDLPTVLDDFRRQVARALHARFGCSLATLWCLEGELGDRRMLCVTSLSDLPDESLAGTVLYERELGEYFAALLREGVFNSPDALSDERLAGLREGYLRPNAVGALLDATARVNGQLIGIVCIEQRGETRVWSLADEMDLRRAVDQISLSLSRIGELLHCNFQQP
jgi:GAF domain-containing protein